MLNGQYNTKTVRTKSNKGIRKNTNYQIHSQRRVKDDEELPKLLVTHDTNEDDILNYRKQHRFQESVVESGKNRESQHNYYETYSNDSQYDLYDSSVVDVDKNSDISNSTNNDTNVTTCKRCIIRREDKLARIELIKKDILSKLRFTTLPNMTLKKIPKIPPIAQVMESYGMQSDAPYGMYPDAHDDFQNEEEYYGHTERLYTIAQQRKYICSCNIFLHI